MASAITPSKDEKLTRLLLKAGIPVGPLFVGLSLIVGLTSSGFDFGKHEVSLLLVGSTGWLQMANFILTGMLGVATAVGLRRALHPGKAGTWGPTLVGLYGIFLIIAGCFHLSRLACFFGCFQPREMGLIPVLSSIPTTPIFLPKRESLKIRRSSALCPIE